MKLLPPIQDVSWSPETPVKGLYRQLLFSRRAGLKTAGTLPTLRCAAAGLRIDLDHLRQYRAVTQDPDTAVVPLLYPHVLMGNAHLALVAHRDMPFRVLGLLHLRNHVLRHRAFTPDERLDVECGFTTQRITEKGLEFDLESRVTIQGTVVWHSISTLFKRGKFGRNGEISPRAALFPQLQDSQEVASYDVPPDIGRQYARVSGDYNPIHVSWLAAKLFGFRTMIAHGMWTTARTLNSGLSVGHAPIRLDVAFKGPVFTGSHVRAIRQGDRWDLLCDGNPKPVLQGLLRPTTVDDIEL